MKEPIFEYFDIITNRLQNPLPKGEYGECHHIYPKSLGGWNLKCNLVKLTVAEHRRCHELLPYIFKDLGDENGYQKMLHAWYMVSHTRNGIETTSKEHEKLMKEYRTKQSEFLIDLHKKQSFGFLPGGTSWNKGIPMSEEAKRKNAEAHKEKRYSEETNRKRSESLKVYWDKVHAGLIKDSRYKGDTK